MRRDEFFPDSERVIYARSPLVSVISQLRFPTILRIDTQPPADFQDAVREAFPVLDRQLPGGLDQLPPEIAKAVGAAIGQARGYNFRTENGSTTITLESGSLAVVSNAYDRWETFVKNLQLALDTLVRVYRPSYFTRIGLRYQNALVPQQIGVDAPWSEIVSPNIVGEFAHDGFGGGRIVEAHRHLRVFDKATSEGFLLQHGLGPSSEQVPAYIIDIDCYAEKKIEVSDALSYFDRFNYRAGRAFRWCISDGTHLAMQPSGIPEKPGDR